MKRLRLRSQSGMTQVELIVTLGVMALTLTVYFVSTYFFQRQQQSQVESIEGVGETLTFVQTLKRDLSASVSITAVSGGFELTQVMDPPPNRTIRYSIAPADPSCSSAIRKSFTCTKITRTDGSASILLAQPIRFEWCVPAVSSDPAIGPNCPPLAAVSTPAAAASTPRRFVGQIETPGITSSNSLKIPFVLTLEGMPWGNSQTQILRTPQ